MSPSLSDAGWMTGCWRKSPAVSCWWSKRSTSSRSSGSSGQALAKKEPRPAVDTSRAESKMSLICCHRAGVMGGCCDCNLDSIGMTRGCFPYRQAMAAVKLRHPYRKFFEGTFPGLFDVTCVGARGDFCGLLFRAQLTQQVGRTFRSRCARQRSAPPFVFHVQRGAFVDQHLNDRIVAFALGSMERGIARLILRV